MAENKPKILPRYSIGQVIDLSCKRGSRLPMRIKILTIFYNHGDGVWRYQVHTESSVEKVIMTEREISNLACHKNSKAYSVPFIARMYADGYRWCGNFSRLQADCKGMALRDNADIESIRLYPAYNNTGSCIPDQCGLWIKYNTSIGDDGIIRHNALIDDMVRQIK